jgi:hypothetical protein
MARHELNFTKEALERLPLPEPGARAEYFDSKTPGLHLRITAAGVKTFCMKRWVKAEGKSERIAIGRFPDMTIENARKAAGRINAAIAEGANPAAAIRERKAELTFGEMFEEYAERYAVPRGLKTFPAMRETFERYLGELPDTPRKPRGKLRTKHPAGVNWQRRKLSSIKRKDVHALHAALGKAGLQTTANRVAEMVSVLFNKAREWDLYAGDNPAGGIEPYRETNRAR